MRYGEPFRFQLPNPLTSVAAQYTDDRRDNFDIYLPESLARHNRFIFGVLYVAGIFFTIVRWMGAPD